MKAKIIGSGLFLPPFVMSNENLAQIFPTGKFPEFNQPDLDWNEQWIENKLGIKERRFAFDFNKGVMRNGYYDLDMGEKAARQALQDADIGIEKIDVIIYLTSTPEYFMPDPACMLHLRLGAKKDTAAFALTSVGCGGFIYGMNLANSLIVSSKAKTVLLVASISTSAYAASYYEPTITPERKKQLMVRDRINASIFGDGAGAMILKKAHSLSRSGIIGTYWGATGKDNPVIFEGGGSRHPATIKSVLNGIHFFNMDTKLVKSNGPALFERTMVKILKSTWTRIKDVDYFIFHQINYKLLRAIAEKINIPIEKMAVHVDRYGNLDTATLAIGFHEAKQANKIKKGDLVLFVAIGAGWQYGSALVRL